MQNLESKKNSLISTDALIEDFDFVYETLRAYYPYFDTNKKVHKVDWLENREKYRQRIFHCKTDTEFYDTMNNILFDLNNDHTHLLPIEMGLFLYVLYKNFKRPDWRVDMAEIFHKPKVVERYEITSENMDKILKSQATYESDEVDSGNLVVGDVITDKVGYMWIREMVNPDLSMESFKEEYDVITNYLERIRDYPILIIDIRGNGGGNSDYWSDFLMPLIVDKEYSQQTYSFIKGGELLRDVINKGGFKKYTDEVKSYLNFPEETFNMIDGFSHVLSDLDKVVPHKDSINFKGKIYLLVDKHVYSSSEMMASFAKESGMATLVGERTGGGGIGSDPILIDLPNSGYVLRFAKEMGITEKGSVNEIDQTEPDIVVSNPLRLIEFNPNGQIILNNDKAIMVILEREGVEFGKSGVLE